MITCNLLVLLVFGDETCGGYWYANESNELEVVFWISQVEIYPQALLTVMRMIGKKIRLTWTL